VAVLVQESAVTLGESTNRMFAVHYSFGGIQVLAEILPHPRDRRYLGKGRKQFLFRIEDPKPAKGVIQFPEDLQLVSRFVPQKLVHARHTKQHVAGDHHGAPGADPVGIQLGYLPDSGSSNLHIHHIT